MQQVATLATEFAIQANSATKVLSFDAQKQDIQQQGGSESNTPQVFSDDLAREIAKQEKHKQNSAQHLARQERKDQLVTMEKQRLETATQQKDAQHATDEVIKSEAQQRHNEQAVKQDRAVVSTSEIDEHLGSQASQAAEKAQRLQVSANTVVSSAEEMTHSGTAGAQELLPTQWDELLLAAQNTSTELNNSVPSASTKEVFTAAQTDIDATNLSDSPELFENSDNVLKATYKPATISESLPSVIKASTSVHTETNTVMLTDQNQADKLDVDGLDNVILTDNSSILPILQEETSVKTEEEQSVEMHEKTTIATALANALQDNKMSYLRQSEGRVSGSENATLLTKGSIGLGGMNNPKDKTLDPVLSMTTQLTPEQVESLAQQTTSKLAQAGVFDGQNEAAKTQFIGQFKAALGEVKEQLDNGRVPGLDLRSLVQSALPIQDGGVAKAIDGVTQQLQQNLPSIQQALQQSTQQNLQQVANGTEIVGSIQDIQRHSAETQQLSTEQNKATSTPSSKPLNMEKPEGMQQLTEKVRFMANNRQITADMRLDPADLGSMQIRVSMQGDTASVSFVVQNAQAREVLEQATARLSEMLSEQGIQLGESNIQQDNSSADNAPEDTPSFATKHADTQNSEFSDESEQDGNIIAEQRITNGNIGGIDFYA